LPAQWREERFLGAGKPSLAVEPQHRLEQGCAPALVEVRGDLVEKEDRRLTANLALQSCLG